MRWGQSLTVTEDEVALVRIKYAEAAAKWGWTPPSVTAARDEARAEKMKKWKEHLLSIHGVREVPWEEIRLGDYGVPD